MFSQMLTGAVETSFYGSHTRAKGLGNLSVAAAFLHEGEEGAILGAKLGKGVAEGIELLGIHRAGRLGHILVLGRERGEYPPQLLPAEVVDAGVASEAEEPRLELGRSLQAVEGPNHLDEDLLREVLYGITTVCHGVDEARHSVLVGHDELALSAFIAALRAANKVDQLSRFSGFHVRCIAVPSQT